MTAIPTPEVRTVSTYQYRSDPPLVTTSPYSDQPDNIAIIRVLVTIDHATGIVKPWQHSPGFQGVRAIGHKLTKSGTKLGNSTNDRRNTSTEFVAPFVEDALARYRHATGGES